MKTLPKNFVIERNAKNPLWNKYIAWFNTTYCQNSYGISSMYLFYGLIDGKASNYSLKEIENRKNVYILTLEQWEEIVNGFVLPEKWAIKATPETFDVILTYANERLKRDVLAHYSIYFHFPEYRFNMCTSNNLKSGYTEITFEQFKKYVLKEEEHSSAVQYTIQDLAEGKCAIENDGTLEQLKEVLNTAYPQDKGEIYGKSTYYYKMTSKLWNCRDEKPIIPTISVKELYKQLQNTMENKKIIGYKCPTDLSDNTGKTVVKKGDLFKKVENHYKAWDVINTYFGLPKEIVET